MRHLPHHVATRVVLEGGRLNIIDDSIDCATRIRLVYRNDRLQQLTVRAVGEGSGLAIAQRAICVVVDLDRVVNTWPPES